MAVVAGRGLVQMCVCVCVCVYVCVCACERGYMRVQCARIVYGWA